ncbi:hypothetical protein [Ornithinimicrobium kibberense]|uniref:hypothetical protein n=1 Tax=Ornithinimicrobium kibberense TaxID=282060 RepID=UPI0036134524
MRWHEWVIRVLGCSRPCEKARTIETRSGGRSGAALRDVVRQWFQRLAERRPLQEELPDLEDPVGHRARRLYGLCLEDFAQAGRVLVGRLRRTRRTCDSHHDRSGDGGHGNRP